MCVWYVRDNIHTIYRNCDIFFDLKFKLYKHLREDYLLKTLSLIN